MYTPYAESSFGDYFAGLRMEHTAGMEDEVRFAQEMTARCAIANDPHPAAQEAGSLMKRLTLILDAIVGILSAAPAQESRHYVFCGLDRERITEPAVVETPALVGALLKYRWSELELRRNEYNFSAIRHDVSFLVREWKR